MDKYIGFDIESKKTGACVVQKSKPLTNRRRPPMKSSKSNTKISVATFFLRHFFVRDAQRALKPFTIFTIFVKRWYYRVYGIAFFLNLEITGCWVVHGL